MNAIYDTALIVGKDDSPVKFQQELNRVIQAYQGQGLEVEVQFAPYRAHDRYDYCALVVARKSA